VKDKTYDERGSYTGDSYIGMRSSPASSSTTTGSSITVSIGAIDAGVWGWSVSHVHCIGWWHVREDMSRRNPASIASGVGRVGRGWGCIPVRAGRLVRWWSI